MHRTQRKTRSAFWTIVLSLTIGGVGPAWAQPVDKSANFLRGAETSRKVIVPIGGSQRLQMKDKKIIRQVINPKDSIAIVQALPGDPRTVLINGREAGVTKITVVAEDNTEEVYEVLVEFDIGFLRGLLERTVPTASLQLTPAASGAVIISGNVAHAEDIDIIMRTAQGVVAAPDRIVNAMRVGGVQEVQLDVIVAFVSRTELRRMSFDFLSVGKHHNFSSTLGGALINPDLGATLPATPGISPAISNVVGSANGAPANFFLALSNNEEAFFGLLQALRNENLAKILAQPKLVTLSGRTATLLSGGQQAIPEAAGLGSISVRFEPFGTQLSFLPIVLGNGKIHLEVEPEVSNIDASVGTSIAGTVVPGRNTQRVHTTVVIEDGQTLAIGGLIQNTVSGTTVKVPILGDLPFLGAFFSSKNYSENESELVVLVTPHLVDAMACDQLPKILPGQETRSPDDFELFLEGILEAPRGKREVCPGGHYVPAYKNGPTADSFPCDGGCGHGCGHGCKGETSTEKPCNLGSCPNCGKASQCSPATQGSCGGCAVDAPAKTNPKSTKNAGTSTAKDLLPSTEAIKAATGPDRSNTAGSTAPVNGTKPFALPAALEAGGAN